MIQSHVLISKKNITDIYMNIEANVYIFFDCETKYIADTRIIIRVINKSVSIIQTIRIP